MKSSRRNLVVFSTLLAALTLTSVLLKALAPEPLSAGAATAPLPIEPLDEFEALFQTSAEFQPARWQYIYIHHTKTLKGSTLSLGQPGVGLQDHFVIGNGDGCGDGFIEFTSRWSTQQNALPLGAKIDRACISICLIGDFDQSTPTPRQLERLAQLVQTLQGRCRIPADNVIMPANSNTPVGVGQNFPVSRVRRDLLR